LAGCSGYGVWSALFNLEQMAEGNSGEYLRGFGWICGIMEKTKKHFSLSGVHTYVHQ